jgi:hypothetical protein
VGTTAVVDAAAASGLSLSRERGTLADARMAPASDDKRESWRWPTGRAMSAGDARGSIGHRSI